MKGGGYVDALKNGDVGYAYVVCDLLHYGHLQFLKKCRQTCDYLIVGVYTDKLTASYKRIPVIPYEERIALVKELRCVDEVRTVEAIDCTPMLRRLVEEGYNVKYLFHGDDWDIVLGSDYIESVGGELIQFPYNPTEDSEIKWLNTTSIITKIIQKIKESK